MLQDGVGNLHADLANGARALVTLGRRGGKALGQSERLVEMFRFHGQRCWKGSGAGCDENWTADEGTSEDGKDSHDADALGLSIMCLQTT